VALDSTKKSDSVSLSPSLAEVSRHIGAFVQLISPRGVSVFKLLTGLILSLLIGFKTPQTAIEGTYVDKKCPFTSDVSIRGRIFKGVVISTKMSRTIVIRRDYLHYIKKYNRFEKRHKTVSAHCSPAFRIKVGDVVTVGQCRPLSKTVRFNVLRKEVQRIEGNVKKVFVLF